MQQLLMKLFLKFAVSWNIKRWFSVLSHPSRRWLRAAIVLLWFPSLSFKMILMDCVFSMKDLCLYWIPLPTEEGLTCHITERYNSLIGKAQMPPIGNIPKTRDKACLPEDMPCNEALSTNLQQGSRPPGSPLLYANALLCGNCTSSGHTWSVQW